MIDLDHRLVVVGGLVLSCLIYQVPLYTVCFVILCGFAVYVRNKYNDGWRFALFGGGGGNGFGFVRQIRHGRYRHANTSSPNLSPSLSTSEQDLKQRNDESSTNSNSPFANLSRRSCPSFSFNSTPKCRLDLKNYDVSPRFHNQNTTFHSRLLSPSFPSDMGRPRHRTSVYDVPNINNQGRMDSTFDGPVGTPRPKYSGVGVYPFVQLEPRRSALLSHCNSTMVKNRVTVKIAHPERQSSNHSLNRSSPKVSFSSTSQECGTVVEALNTSRKRPLKDDGGNNMEHSATKRRHHQLENEQTVPHLPSEITQHFESQLSDETLAILSQPMETTVEGQDETTPSTVGRAKTNAIHSSYSSSARFSVADKRTKRKPESICDETPNVKFGRNDSPNRNDNRPASIEQQDDEEVETSNVGTSEDISEVLPPKSEEKVTSYTFHATMTGARNPMPVHVPTYIPSMEDYLEDKKAEEERLQKILGRFTVVNTTKNKDESNNHISIVPISTNADSNFQTPAIVTVTKDSNTESVTQPDNLNNVPSIVVTTSISSASLPTSSLFVASTTSTEVESASSTTYEASPQPPPPNPTIFPFIPTTVGGDKNNTDSPFNNSITSPFNVSQLQTASSANKNDPVTTTTTFTSPNPLGITSTKPPVNVTSTLTASPFVMPSTASFSFGTVSQNTSSVAPSLQFKASDPVEQQKNSNSPFTFGSKPLNSNPVADSTTKPSSVATGGFSFPIPNAVSTAVATTSVGSSLFSNVTPPFGSSNQIVTTSASESNNLNNVSFGGNKPTSSFGGQFTFGQNFNPPAKTESSTNGGQSNTSSTFQFGSSSLQNSSPFGNATPNTTSAVPQFGTAITTFGTTTSSTVPTFGTTTSMSVPTFGTTTSMSVPTFGTTTSMAVPTFGTTTSMAVPTFGTTTSMAVPTFGTTASAIPTFGTKTSSTSFQTFGITTSTSIPTFGTATSMAVSTFGTATSTAVPTFGTATSTAIPMFGTTTTTAVPTFGTTTSTAIPTFGTTFGNIKTAFGSSTTVNGTNVNGETTNGGQFGIGQQFSFGTSTQSNQTNSGGVFTFGGGGGGGGGVTPSSNNNSFVVPPTAPQSFDFSSSSKPSFNFGSSTPTLSSIPGTSAQQPPNMNMFSVTPNQTSARRSKHPTQRHRYHR